MNDSYDESVKDALSIVTALSSDPGAESIAATMIKQALDRVEPGELIHALGALTNLVIGLAATYSETTPEDVLALVAGGLNTVMDHNEGDPE